MPGERDKGVGGNGWGHQIDFGEGYLRGGSEFINNIRSESAFSTGGIKDNMTVTRVN